MEVPVYVAGQKYPPGHPVAQWVAANTPPAEAAGPIAAVSPKAKPPKRTGRVPPLLPAAFRPPGTWVVPVKVVPSTNAAAIDRKRIGRSARERAPVFRTLGRYHRELAPWVDVLTDGGRVRVTLTRLGPGLLDALNVGDAVKYVADAVADLLALDDGDPRLDWVCRAERAKGYGVRVELAVA